MNSSPPTAPQNQNPAPFSGQTVNPAIPSTTSSPNSTSITPNLPVNPGISATPGTSSSTVADKPASIPPTSTPQVTPAPPTPNPASTNTTNTFPPAPNPYSDQTIAADLTASNVIGKAVTVTDDNLPIREKIPLMKISLLLIFIITGFSGSFLYFRFTSASPARNTVLITQPTVTISSKKPTVISAPIADSANPFATPTASFVNPFAPTSTPAYQNPFGETTGNEAGDNQTYRNPFEDLK